MKHWKVCLLTFALLAATFVTQPRSADQTLIAPGSPWKYRDLGTNLGTSWRTLGYNDASWPTGSAQLGYGDGDEVTVLSYGTSSTNKYVTSYFRRSFTVTNPASFEALTVRYVRDDGCVIYLNGTEVVRSNMPAGTISYTTLAPAAIGGADESAWLEAQIDPSLLVAGTNVVAVEIHQQAKSSSDISFDLELQGTDALPPLPTVTLGTPADHSVTNTTAATFSASASAPAGLASATLFVGGPPQTVVFSGASQMEDAQISADTPSTPNGTGGALTVDGQGPHAHGLMKFPTLIGSAAGQVPAGSVITSATLQVNCTNAGNVMGLYRLIENWVESQATWTERAAGLAWSAAGADGAASNAGVALGASCTSVGTKTINITQFVQEWSNGAANYGFVMVDSGTDGVGLTTSESSTAPVLTVVYKTNKVSLGTQPLSGTSAPISFAATLPGGQTYGWNVQVTDATGRQSWATADFELTVNLGAPDEPVLVSPASESAGVAIPAQLSALVSTPGGGQIGASVEVRKAAAPEFTLVVLPDTQHYSEAFPAIYTTQTQWIVDNKAARNIVFVTHEGDIVEHYSLLSEWQAANTSMLKLDGVVPYGVLPGNHDQPTTLYNQFFPYTRFQGQPWYGGHYQSLNDYNYQLFSGGGVDFVIVHMAFCPTAGAVTWADSVYKSYPDRIGIMTTHGYLNESAQRTVGGCSNTQYLWDGLAVPNPNLWFMLSGHVHDESRRTDVVNGHPVFQLMADFQDRPSGGQGWLRTMRFVPADNKIYVQTYSPWLNQFETDANSEFTLDFPMGDAFAAAGAVSVPSGSTASITPAGLLPDTKYEWRMTVTNSGGQSRVGPVWTFTTGNGSANQPPVANSQAVTTQQNVAVAVTLSATDAEGSPLSYAIVNGPTHGALSGTAPNVTYTPVAGYSGGESFTFVANDGQADSNVATVSITVTPVNAAPTVVTPAGASPTPVPGTTTSLSALGADDAGESNLTYTWATTGTPPAAVTFGANGTNAAKTTTATFTKAGDYTFQVTIKDAGNLMVTSDVAVTVTGTVTTITVTPATASVGTGGSQAFSASAKDQFGAVMAPQPAIGWSVDAGGTIDAAGLFTAGGTAGGPYTVTAATGAVNGTATITVTPINAAPTVATAAGATPSPVPGATTVLSALGADDAGEANLTYTWATTGTPPAAVTFSANGTNAAKTTTATFTKAGDYTFQVTIKDVGNLMVTSDVAVTVTGTVTTITVTPATASVGTGGSQAFSASAKDQFGAVMTPQPAIGWSLDAGGTISGAGLFTAGGTAGGPYTVTAATGAVNGTATITVTPVNAAPTVATAAGASPSPVFSSTTTLSALGADDAGEANLTYTWATTGTPPAAVTFGANGTNAAKTTIATFTKAGNYSFQVTIKDAGNLTVTSNVAVTVTQTVTTISVTPLSASVVANGTQAFTATATDQFGLAMAPAPSFTWGVTGGGTISASGLFTAGGAAGGPFTVTAANAGKTGAASVTVTAASVVAYVQGATLTNDATSSTVAKAFTTAHVAGDLIVAAVSWGSNASVSCSDTQGNTYVVATTQWDSVNNQSLAICYAANAKAGANTVTATFSSAAGYRRLLIHAYRGVALVNPVDKVAKNLANGPTGANAITSTAAVTTVSGDLIFGAVMMDDPGVTTITAGTGFTQRLSVNNKDLASEDQVQATAGSIAATQTFGAAHRYLAQMVAFKKR